MKKFICFCLCFVIIFGISGCRINNENTVNRIMMDTVISITAVAKKDILQGAVSLCQDYENMLSRTKQDSDIYRINNSDGFVEVSEETVYIISTALEFCNKTNGAYDITITPVVDLWDFSKQTVPEQSQIETALNQVDYTKIQISGNTVNANGAKLDLGSAAKGYIADKLCEYFRSNGVKDAVINLGGNVYILGEKYANVGVRDPFDEVNIITTVNIPNKSAVTSGIYQRSFELDGNFYHHIIDTKTGYGVDNDLAAVTIIGEQSLLCDIMSTTCMVLGSENALELIKNTPDIEGLLILKNGEILKSY